MTYSTNYYFVNCSAFVKVELIYTFHIFSYFNFLSEIIILLNFLLKNNFKQIFLESNCTYICLWLLLFY